MIQAVAQSAVPTAETWNRHEFCVDLLGDSFLLWRNDCGWTPGNSTDRQNACHPQLSESATAALIRLIDDVSSSGRPLLRPISAEWAAWAVPVSGHCRPHVAVKIVDNDPDRLVELINRTALCAWTRDASLHLTQAAVHSQEEQLLAYAAQVSEDLEEVTWLRDLATNLELSESGNSVERIAETVLPSLCRLMHALTVVFIRDIPVTGMDTDLPVVWQTGRNLIPRQTCLTILESLVTPGHECVVVRNYSSRQFVSLDFPGVESCVIVPVATDSARLGWLIAVNKDLLPLRRNGNDSDPHYKTYMSEREFGSFEASLMSATAVVLAAHGRNCGLFHEKELLLRGVIRSMINAIDAKDPYTCGHSDRVAEFARLISRELLLSEHLCEQVFMTGLLHDVGKIGVPDHVLNKPDQLTDQEFELIKQHPVIGFEILKHLENLSYVLPGVLHHHEAFDGSGYPHGLAGDQIPLCARILAVADAYDAMTSNRPYRRGMPTERAERILTEGAGLQWDPDCVDAFFRTVLNIRMVARQRITPVLTESEMQSV